VILLGLIFFVGVDLLIFEGRSYSFPRNYEIPQELIPTAQYLQDFPEESDVQIIIERVSEDKVSRDVCVEMPNYWGFDEINYSDFQNERFILDGTVVRNLSTWTEYGSILFSVSRCASKISLPTGLHLVEYHNPQLNINQKWAIEIE